MISGGIVMSRISMNSRLYSVVNWLWKLNSVSCTVAFSSPGSRPTAVLCANDLLAMGLLHEALQLGLRVPEDLAIVGYDDIEFAEAAAVPLTSVRQPRQLLGRTAAELLLDESSNPDHEHQRVTFTPELVVRTSTRGNV
jgi:LacI family transcriptional regulator, galactose operon repressor